MKIAYVDPRGTISSPERRAIIEKYCSNRHAALAYIIVLKLVELKRS
ncbi:MAG: hypothetical protein QXO91_04815 [Desulfurococcaceae archaeon]